MNLLDKMFGRGERDISTVDDYIELYNTFYHNGLAYMTGGGSGTQLQQTLVGGQKTQAPDPSFQGMVRGCYAASGPVFACELVRMSVFSAIFFSWQKMRAGAPTDLVANDPQLRILQRPWVGGTTQDLLVQMILDADLAGNAYVARDGNELVRLRPDWVEIVLEPRRFQNAGGILLDQNGNPMGDPQLGWRIFGYIYTEGGINSGNDPVFLFANEVAHFAPIPDPLANFRGMSWLTPVIREITADHAMTRHQRKFFDNGATVNMVVKYQPGTKLDDIKAFREIMDERHEGTENAYKTMHLAPGADPTPVGANMRQVDFTSVRGAGETRIAAAANVPPIIAGFTEGLESATYSNYSQARRRFADATMHPLWQNVCGSLEILFSRFDDERLWYDASKVPFLREDAQDAAAISKVEADTINTLITAGYTPESVIAAIKAQDWDLLQHTGLVSVQLMQPGANSASTGSDIDADGDGVINEGRSRFLLTYKDIKQLTGGRNGHA